jgi:GNAT superfamily N-acetyltransferase
MERIAAEGAEISTLAEYQRGAGVLADLHEMVGAAMAGAPDHFPALSLEMFERWLHQPGALADGSAIASHAGRPIGMIALTCVDDHPERVLQSLTCVRPEHRRRGVATALKVCAIDFARRRGYQTIVAYNADGNKALLALNEQVGFRQTFGYVAVEKRL